MTPAVEVKELYKSYGSSEVLKGISFSVQEGEIFAILGPNGAGKTTCVEILEGFRPFDSGSISVLGFDPQLQSSDFRNRTGVVTQISGIEQELTPLEALRTYGSSYSHSASALELLELVGISAKANERIGKLSGGQKKRLDLALGLVGNPDLIFLDEPTTGFDPEARVQAWNVINNLRESGKTILLTSHYMEEVERLADKMAILLNGRIIWEGKPGDLRQGETIVSFKLPPGWDVSTAESWQQKEAKILDDKMQLLTDFPTELLNQVTSKAVGEGLALENLSVQTLGLEDAYLKIIGEEADYEEVNYKETDYEKTDLQKN